MLRKSIEAIRPRGVVVAYGFAPGPEVTFDIRSLFFAEKQLRGTMASDIEDLMWGLEQVHTGRIRPLLDRTLPLSQAAEDHRLIATIRLPVTSSCCPGPNDPALPVVGADPNGGRLTTGGNGHGTRGFQTDGRNTMCITLTDENFDAEVLKKPGSVLVIFSADWCGPCHMMGPVIAELAADCEGAQGGKLGY